MTLHIRPLARTDAPWLTELYAANSRDNLTPEQRSKRGFVQGAMNAETLEGRLGGPGSFVAEADGSPVGVVLTSEAGDFPGGPPGLAINVAKDAGLAGLVLYGPVLVAEGARGKGVLRALTNHVFTHLAGRYSHAIAFAERENTVSLTAHAKLGWCEIGTFEAREREYAVLEKGIPSDSGA